MLERARELLRSSSAGTEAVLSVPSRLYSQMLGQHRGNLAILQREFSLSSLRILSSPDQTEPLLRLK